MSKYIDADRLKEEIEKQMESVVRHSDLGEPDDLYYDGRRSILVMLRDFIDSLQQEMWKPNKEQMEALNVLNLYGNLSYVGQQNQLILLYQDLKKLM